MVIEISRFHLEKNCFKTEKQFAIFVSDFGYSADLVLFFETVFFLFCIYRGIVV
jgi:hypothetical protein